MTGVNKRYAGTPVLHDIDLTIPGGALVCLLGPSGCGKTTLLRILAGLERADRGRLSMHGRDIGRLSPQDRRFGVVFQSYALFPNLSVGDNVAFGMQSRDRSRRTGELLRLVGLEDSERKFPAQLSGGQQQRVALARALALSPSLLLLDEPFSALDPAVRARLRNELKALHRRLGLTTILVTHDQEEALCLAEQIVVMMDGRVVQVGSPREIYERPVNPFVAGFVGEANFVPCRRVAGGHVALPRWQGTLRWSAGELGGNGTGLLMCRPEHLRIVGNGCPQGPHTEACVAGVDYLGSEARLRVVVAGDGQQLTLRQRLSPGHAPAIGDQVTLSLDTTHCRFFTEAA